MSDKHDQKCFIITPIGSDRTAVRDALNGLLQNVLQPVLGVLGFKEKNIVVAHQITESGSINSQLIDRIINDDLCITNLTGLNPNVLYELAVRHAVGKPVITIAEEGTNLPFDIIDQRTIFYKDTMLGAEELKRDLTSMVDSVLNNATMDVDNPVIKSIREKSILKEIQSDGKPHSELSLILAKINDLDKKINAIRKDNRGLYKNNSNISPNKLMELYFEATPFPDLMELRLSLVPNNYPDRVYTVVKEGDLLYISTEITDINYIEEAIKVAGSNKVTLVKKNIIEML